VARETETLELIRQLAREVGPLHRVPPLRAAMAQSLLAWAATAVAGFSLAVLLGRWPRALTVVWGHPESALVLLGLAAVGGGALLYGLAATVPGRESGARLGFAVAAVGSVATLGAGLHGPFAPPGAGYRVHPLPWDLVCIGYVSLFALPTAAVALRLCLQRTPMRPFQTALAIALGSSSLGAVLIHALCGEGSQRHTLASHVLATVIAVPAIGLILLAALSRGTTRAPR
jgi:hypothetical protein